MRQLFAALRLLTRPCSQFSMLVSESMDRHLTPTERFALRVHLAYCTGCRRFRRHLRAIREMLGGDRLEGEAAEASPGPVLSTAARARINALLARRP